MSNPKYKYQLTVDGKTYDVSKENIDKYGWDGYAESYPDAKIRMRDDEGADYDVPIGRLETMQRNGLHPFITRYDASEPQEKVPEGSQTDSSDNGQLLSKPWIPDSQQKAAITANLGGISRSARQTVDDFAERVDKDNHPQMFGPRVSITPQINMQTGQRDNASDYSYLDLVQHQRREAADVTTGGKLRNAYRRLADLQGKLAERGMQLKEKAESNRPKSIGEGLSRIWNMLEKPRDFDPFGQAGLSPLATI